MGTAKGFWNWNAERYAQQPIRDEASYRKKVEITQRHLTSEMNVVEFGCGTGSTAVQHAPHVKSYLGIDVAERMVEIGRGKAAEAGLTNLRFAVGTLEEAGPGDRSCDAILGLNILHLVPDLEGTLATVARMLVPGGLFVASTVAMKDLKGNLRWIGLAARLLPFLPSPGWFSVEQLEGKLEAAGFAVDERFEQHPGVVFHVARKR